MSISLIVEALIAAGATSEMILAAVRADEKSRLHKEAQLREAARQRKNKSRNNNDHVTVTPVTDCDTCDTPLNGSNGFPHPSLNSLIPTKENPPKGGQKKKPLELPDWMPLEAWEGFKEMRIKINKPMTDRAQRMAIGKLEKFRIGGHDPTEILNQSTFSDYQDLYEPKENTYGKQSAKPTFRTEGQRLAEKYRLAAELEEQAATCANAGTDLCPAESVWQDPGGT